MWCQDAGRDCAWSVAVNVCNKDGRLWHKTGNNGRCIHESGVQASAGRGNDKSVSRLLGEKPGGVAARVSKARQLQGEKLDI